MQLNAHQRRSVYLTLTKVNLLTVHTPGGCNPADKFDPQLRTYQLEPAAKANEYKRKADAKKSIS